ncbi:MAG: alginate lyase family protein [Candidatus Azobacteroides sp.]|nr:alginate lyase family protein [Candidatus Azobacteroides sp.]
MKYLHILLTMLLFTGCMNTETKQEKNRRTNQHSMHPVAQIDFVKNRLQQKTEPYYTAYLQLIRYADSIQHAAHHALSNFAVPGYYDNPEEHQANSLAIQKDAFGAYCSALVYQLSGEKKYGEKAVYFLNAWASTNKEYSEHDGVLVMAYSGSGLMIGAELMADSEIWEEKDRENFRQWVRSVYQPAANEIRVHKNNWADWGRFGSLLAASFLNEPEEVSENIRLIKSDLFEKIAMDGSMLEETRRGENGIWYTYFSLSPMTAACWLVYNLTGENLFDLEENNLSIKNALNYLLYYEQHPTEWPFYDNPNTGRKEPWPENLFEAISGIYQDEKYKEFVQPARPVIYPKHHFAWVFPTLMPVELSFVK